MLFLDAIFTGLGVIFLGCGVEVGEVVVEDGGGGGVGNFSKWLVKIVGWWSPHVLELWRSLDGELSLSPMEELYDGLLVVCHRSLIVDSWRRSSKLKSRLCCGLVSGKDRASSLSYLGRRKRRPA